MTVSPLLTPVSPSLCLFLSSDGRRTFSHMFFIWVFTPLCQILSICPSFSPLILFCPLRKTTPSFSSSSTLCPFHSSSSSFTSSVFLVNVQFLFSVILPLLSIHFYLLCPFLSSVDDSPPPPPPPPMPTLFASFLFAQFYSLSFIVTLHVVFLYRGPLSPPSLSASLVTLWGDITLVPASYH